MRILLLGGAGQVARAVAASAPPEHTVIVKSRQELDITDDIAVTQAISDSRAEWVINGAAYTAVDRAQAEPELATEINSRAVGHIARAASRQRCRLLHLSTDFVFDGTSNRAYLPTDAPNPLSVYGASKLRGEEKALQGGLNPIILRTAWVYAATGRNFVLTMLRLMRERSEVKVVCDQIGSPTWATGMGQAIWGLVASAAPAGIYHWTDLGVASWYDFAVAIRDEALGHGLLDREVRIIPIRTADYPTAAIRPPFSVLDTFATRASVSTVAHHWRHNLRLMLDEVRTQ